MPELVDSGAEIVREPLATDEIPNQDVCIDDVQQSIKPPSGSSVATLEEGALGFVDQLIRDIATRDRPVQRWQLRSSMLLGEMPQKITLDALDLPLQGLHLRQGPAEIHICHRGRYDLRTYKGTDKRPDRPPHSQPTPRR